MSSLDCKSRKAEIARFNDKPVETIDQWEYKQFKSSVTYGQMPCEFPKTNTTDVKH